MNKHVLRYMHGLGAVPRPSAFQLWLLLGVWYCSTYSINREMGVYSKMQVRHQAYAKEMGSEEKEIGWGKRTLLLVNPTTIRRNLPMRQVRRGYPSRHRIDELIDSSVLLFAVVRVQPTESRSRGRAT
ncbi:hypothetical protein F4813DRAFT_343963 [Daldinia decipiens]|uniref:uncharacterized protein n=1 Tax=Daldinia decipiens TaxID=326647 RepID=UPI0020C2205F|nr:uncharacterized protein F4813DRAFT_343963 [Daldinia decipiens]KAI1662247.1 hypothetical protein F4813DRAFT_343963 [Daldinia decipiens]